MSIAARAIRINDFMFDSILQIIIRKTFFNAIKFLNLLLMSELGGKDELLPVERMWKGSHFIYLALSFILC